jgi:cyclophilin family peptidyl-prolyl cis-trans isomerase
MTLESDMAPEAVARVLQLVRAHHYDGVLVHRSVEGLAVQFGDRTGDGYGSSGLPPLPSELGPVAFGGADVGMALAGRDTGSAQLFVTLAAYPELDGEYPRLGRAGPGWEALAEGDLIERVTVVEEVP